MQQGDEEAAGVFEVRQQPHAPPQLPPNTRLQQGVSLSSWTLLREFEFKLS